VADEGHSREKLAYAERLAYGDGVPQDRELPARYFGLAAQEGDWWIKIEVWDRLALGNGLHQDAALAARHFKGR
jgi:TPR repeat protein